jgi:hypothetical protein
MASEIAGGHQVSGGEFLMPEQTNRNKCLSGTANELTPYPAHRYQSTAGSRLMPNPDGESFTPADDLVQPETAIYDRSNKEGDKTMTDNVHPSAHRTTGAHGHTRAENPHLTALHLIKVCPRRAGARGGSPPLRGPPTRPLSTTAIQHETTVSVADACRWSDRAHAPPDSASRISK